MCLDAVPVMLGRLTGIAAADDDVTAVEEASCAWYPVCIHIIHMIRLIFLLSLQLMIIHTICLFFFGLCGW